MRSKAFRLVFYLLAVVSTFLSVVIVSNAAAITCDIPAKDADLDSQFLYEENMFDSVLNKPYSGSEPLESLDVSPSGQFVMSFSAGTVHHINVYDQHCQFLAQYVIKENGALLATFDQADSNLILFPVRKNILIKIGRDGEFISSAPSFNASEAITSLSALRSFTKESNGKHYIFSGKQLFSAENQNFTVTDDNGTVLFAYTPPREYFSSIFIGLSFLLTIGLIYLRYRRHQLLS